MLYPAKGTYTRLQIKTILDSSKVFQSLTDDQKNVIMNNAAKRISTLRNNNDLEDYQADTLGQSVVVAPFSALVGLWDDRPMNVPIGFEFFAQDKDRSYTFNGVEYV